VVLEYKSTKKKDIDAIISDSKGNKKEKKASSKLGLKNEK
jgi:hypothetical protein